MTERVPAERKKEHERKPGSPDSIGEHRSYRDSETPSTVTGTARARARGPARRPGHCHSHRDSAAVTDSPSHPTADPTLPPSLPRLSESPSFSSQVSQSVRIMIACHRASATCRTGTASDRILGTVSRSFPAARDLLLVMKSPPSAFSARSSCPVPAAERHRRSHGDRHGHWQAAGLPVPRASRRPRRPPRGHLPGPRTVAGH